MFRQNDSHLVRAALSRKTVGLNNRTFTFSKHKGSPSVAASYRSMSALVPTHQGPQISSLRTLGMFSTTSRLAAVEDFRTSAGKHAEPTKTLLQRIEEKRRAHEQHKQEEACECEEEEWEQRQAEADVGCDNPLENIYHRSIYSAYGTWELGAYGRWGSVWTNKEDVSNERSIDGTGAAEKDAGCNGRGGR